ncbi:nucleotidyltransferase family protein [Pseudarthrobacter oxydans]|uniref:nicotine blue oxidoreductase n=1 Tax=Pseudarthrobacter oxydans TaxID=1671 RepID=UPI003ECE381E
MTNSNMPGTSAVLLAAGAGTRLGLGPKALLPFRGLSLVEIIGLVLLDGGCNEVVVVLGAGADRVQASTNLDHFITVVNPRWQSGMGSSLLCGVVATNPNNHLLVALVDQPGITAGMVRRLREGHRPGRVTAAAYRDAGGVLRRGHPLLIDVTLRAAACESVTGDAGARSFLSSNPGLIDLVDCTDQSTGEDVDTREKMHLLA